MVLWLQVVGILLQGSEPVIGARVWWSGNSIGTLSDSNGYFRLPLPPAFPAWLRTDAAAESLRIEDVADTIIRWEVLPDIQLSPQTIVATRAESQRLNPQAVTVWNRAILTSAPCCNLAEAFEGTALADAVVSDAALGVKRLRLLGFEPVHSPLLYENKPLSIGLYAPWAVQFLPALWIQSVSITKGVGSVINGHEGAAGQIQVQYLSEDKPREPYALEAFARSTGEFFLAGRVDLKSPNGDRYLLLSNVGWTPFQSYALQDHNGDGFLDIPLFQHGHGLGRFLRRDTVGNTIEIDIEGLYDYRWAGEVRFRNPSDIAAVRAWGSYQGLSFLQTSLRRGWMFSSGRGLSLITQGRYLSQALQAGFNRYEARQPLGYIQLVYRQPLGDTRWLLYVGPVFRVAHYAESLSTWHDYDTSWRRIEGIGGVFAELSLFPLPALSVSVGGRLDWHSYWGWQAVPRLHLRWQYRGSGFLRLSAGRAWRIPDPLPEAFPFLMSGRLWRFSFSGWPSVESSWSYGFFWEESHGLGAGIMRWSVNGLQAHIAQPFVWDIEKPWEIEVGSGRRGALYQAVYAEIEYELPDHVRLTAGYRFQEVWWPLRGELRLRPMLPKHRLVGWITWLTLSQRWQVDGILSWYGPQRLPSTAEKEEPYRLSTKTPSYATFTIQLTHRIDQWEIQLAGENLGGFRQSRPVLAADQPFSPQFDASLIWGPVMGRMVSLTFRYVW